jgi:hypothetical protein
LPFKERATTKIDLALSFHLQTLIEDLSVLESKVVLVDVMSFSNPCYREVREILAASFRTHHRLPHIWQI